VVVPFSVPLRVTLFANVRARTRSRAAFFWPIAPFSVPLRVTLLANVVVPFSVPLRVTLPATVACTAICRAVSRPADLMADLNRCGVQTPIFNSRAQIDARRIDKIRSRVEHQRDAREVRQDVGKNRRPALT
jgi:hypothetical protein